MAGLKLRYVGGCHCKEIQYEVLAQRNLNVIECNCTICTKKQIPHFLVPADEFRLIRGHTKLSTYTFGTHQAKHVFCTKCGVQSFFIPRSTKDSIAIVAHCLDAPAPLSIAVEKWDGKNWEKSMEKRAKNRSKWPL